MKITKVGKVTIDPDDGILISGFTFDYSSEDRELSDEYDLEEGGHSGYLGSIARKAAIKTAIETLEGYLMR